MPRLTITITDEQADLLNELSGDGGPYESKSEAVRDFIQRRDEFEHEHDRLQSKCDRLERRVSALIQQREEHSELVAYVEEERLLQRRRDERQRKKDTAGVVTRAKWWLTGMPEQSYDESTEK
jgi:Arc/MetJ-type ribon-helix-helix transcriptional regulator